MTILHRSLLRLIIIAIDRPRWIWRLWWDSKSFSLWCYSCHWYAEQLLWYCWSFWFYDALAKNEIFYWERQTFCSSSEDNFWLFCSFFKIKCTVSNTLYLLTIFPFSYLNNFSYGILSQDSSIRSNNANLYARHTCIHVHCTLNKAKQCGVIIKVPINVKVKTHIILQVHVHVQWMYIYGWMRVYTGSI